MSNSSLLYKKVKLKTRNTHYLLRDASASAIFPLSRVESKRRNRKRSKRLRKAWIEKKPSPHIHHRFLTHQIITINRLLHFSPRGINEQKQKVKIVIVCIFPAKRDSTPVEILTRSRFPCRSELYELIMVLACQLTFSPLPLNVSSAVLFYYLCAIEVPLVDPFETLLPLLLYTELFKTVVVVVISLVHDSRFLYGVIVG